VGGEWERWVYRRVVDGERDEWRTRQRSLIRQRSNMR
jgi:hypothetical protein